MFIFCLIQSTLNSPAREFMFAGVVGIVDGYLISIIKACFRGIGFFLLQVDNPISRAKDFKFTPQLPKRYLDKVLIIGTTNIDFLFDAWVVANYQLTYLVLDAVVNYQPSSLIQIVSNAVIAPSIKPCLSRGEAFNPLSWCAFLDAVRRRRVARLLSFKGLKISILLVIPLINAFESFSINQKLMPFGIDTSTKVAYSQINSDSFIGINRCFDFLVFIYILNLKPSSRVFGMYSYLLNLLVLQSFWELNPNFSILSFELLRHWHGKRSIILNLYPRNNQRKIPFFGQIVRQPWSLVAFTEANSLEQTQERFHASIYQSHSLLSDISIEQAIILIRLADMVVRFVSQAFSFLKKILPAFIQRNIKKILTQATQTRQGIEFLLTKSSQLVLLGCVHMLYFHVKKYIIAKVSLCTALDQESKEVAIAPFNLLVRFASPYLEARGIQIAH